jgi:hypothetical protein
MKAKLLIKERLIQTPNSFVELVLWQLPQPVKGSTHSFKYRLAFVVDNLCVVRYDNEAGKGDHKYVGEVESFYTFEPPRRLLDDFWRDVKQSQEK